MNVIKIRYVDGSKLTRRISEEYSRLLQGELERAGFITEVTAKTHTQWKIGLHMKCFVIDTDVLGQNIRHSRYKASLVGFVKTNLPTWDERVEFNDIINDFLDRNQLRCNIKSGPFTVRTYEGGARCEYDWRHEIPDWMIHNATLDGVDVLNVIEKQTEDHVAEYKEARRKRNRELRAAKKQQQQNNDKNQLRLVVNNS